VNVGAIAETDLAWPTHWLRRRQSDLIFIALVFLAYTVTAWVAARANLTFAVLTGAANAIPVVIFAAIARRIIATHLIGKRVLIQAAGHTALCIAFSLACYWLALVFIGVAMSPSPWDFAVKPFVTSGAAWQLLENVTTYALVAALTYLQAERAASASCPPPAPAPALPKEPPRLLVRSGEDLRRIDIDRIVSISGADDYAELSTLDGKHLVAMTLAEFEATLDPAKFARVHRSRIVNLDFVDRAEPAGGGRLLLHMQTGEMVSTSRSGAQLLKSRVI
jgi:DNA-binding LytR/AlgR family response regulator